MSYAQLDVNASLGALVAGCWLNSALFAVELLQMWRYFTRTAQGGLLQASLALLLVVDTTCTISQYAAVYSYCINHWGDQAYLQRQYWPIIVYLVTTSISALVVQSFLVIRAFRLSRSIVVAVVLGTLIAAGLGGGLATSTIITLFPTYADRGRLNTPVTIWFATSAGCDVAIALVLIYCLNKVRKSAERFEQSNLNASLQHLVAIAVETGSVTSALALIILSTYLHDPEANIATGLCFSLGRLYSLTMLLNVNAAHSLTKRNANSSAGDDDGDRSKFGSTSKRVGLGGIQVGHTTTVQIDDARDDEPIRLDELKDLAKLTQNKERTQAYSFDHQKRIAEEKGRAFRDDEV